MIEERVFEHAGLFALVLGWNERGARPLVVYLHGWGQCGRATDVKGLQRVKDAGSRGLLAESDIESLGNAIVLAPQCPPGQWWDVHAVQALVTGFLEVADVDRGAIVLVGVSMGGYAAWKMLEYYAPLFCSAVIMAGGDDPRRAPLIRCALWLSGIPGTFPVDFDALRRHSKLPRIYIVHGRWDPVVPFGAAQRCFRAMANWTTVELRQVPMRENCAGLGHCVWRACRDDEWWAGVLEGTPL